MEEEIQVWIREDAPPSPPGLLHQITLASAVAGEVLGPLLACLAAWPTLSDTASELVFGFHGDFAELAESARVACLLAVVGLGILLVVLAWGVRALLDHLGTDHGSADLARARLFSAAAGVQPGEDGTGILLPGNGSLTQAPLRTPLTWLVILGLASGVLLSPLEISHLFVTEFLDLALAFWLIPAAALVAWATVHLNPVVALLLGLLGSMGLYGFGALAGLGWMQPGPVTLLAGLPLLLVLPAVLRPLFGTPAIRIGPGGIQTVVLRGGRVVAQEPAKVPTRIRLLPGPRGPVWEAHHADAPRQRYYPVDGDAEVLRAALDEVRLIVHVVGVGRRTRLSDELGEAPGLRLGLPLVALLLLGLVTGEWSRRLAVLFTDVSSFITRSSEIWEVEEGDLDAPLRAREQGLDGISTHSIEALAALARGDLTRAREATDGGLTRAKELPVFLGGSSEWVAATTNMASNDPRGLLTEVNFLAHLDLALQAWPPYRSAARRPGEPTGARQLQALRAATFVLDPEGAPGDIQAASRATAQELVAALERDPGFWQARVLLTLRELVAPHLLIDLPSGEGILRSGDGPAAIEALLLRTRDAVRARRARAEPLAQEAGWGGLVDVIGEELPATIARQAWAALVRARLAGDDLGEWEGVGRALAGTWALHGSPGPRKKFTYPGGAVGYRRAQPLEVLRTALMDEAGFPTSFDEFLGRLEEPAAWRRPIYLGPFEAEDWVAGATRFWDASKRAGFRPSDIPADIRPESIPAGLPAAAQAAGFGEP